MANSKKVNGVTITKTMKTIMGLMYANKSAYGIRKLAGKDGYYYLFGKVRGANTVKNLINTKLIKRSADGKRLVLNGDGAKYITADANSAEFCTLRKAVHLEAFMLDGQLSLQQTEVFVKSENETYINFYNPVKEKGNRVEKNLYETVHKSDFAELSPKVKKTGFEATLFVPLAKVNEGIETLRLHIKEALEERIENIEAEVNTLNEICESVDDLAIANLQPVTNTESSNTEEAEDQEDMPIEGDGSDVPDSQDISDDDLLTDDEEYNILDDDSMAEYHDLIK